MLLLREILTVFVTEQNRSQWFNTDMFLPVSLPNADVKVHCVCLGWIGPPLQGSPGGHRNFPLMHLATSTKRSKGALGISLIQPSRRGKGLGGLRRQVITDQSGGDTHHFHPCFISQNTTTECRPVKG